MRERERESDFGIPSQVVHMVGWLVFAAFPKSKWRWDIWLEQSNPNAREVQRDSSSSHDSGVTSVFLCVLWSSRGLLAAVPLRYNPPTFVDFWSTKILVRCVGSLFLSYELSKHFSFIFPKQYSYLWLIFKIYSWKDT